ncbi:MULTISPECIES: hypothetical protein [unclassified Mesorhizobium]|uniref:hypothetical protein n=1 Tax=unclassified Mesorhizobium TaxID=325217 RepID=UPI0007FF90BA|nr:MULTISPECIES: hypothetical protein [unclassified Mesorhizobium]MDG4886862.1 hypothetical protein [Mesorhizobium sp. WSM4887]OBQ92495.1 hypothetical protein A9K66_10605 [Mesorhizobium sp. AA23]
MKTVRIMIAIAAVTTSVAATNAHAEGFLAGLGRDLGLYDENTRQALDGIHTALNKPLDQLNPFGNGGNVPVPSPSPTWQPQMQQMGNFCMTQAGRFGPGPMNPLGSPCQAFTQWGVQTGWVSR